MGFLGWLVVGGIAGAVIAIAIAINTSARRERLQSHFREKANFTATHIFVGADGVTGIAVDSTSMRICVALQSGGSIASSIHEPEKLISCEVFEDGCVITKTSRMSQIGGAAVGGLAFGGVGALIGGLSGKTRGTEKINRLGIRLIIDEPTQPVFEVQFLGTRPQRRAA